jgi:hypothetical protein
MATRYSGLTGLLAAFALGLPASAADHREAPEINEDPTADIADLYAFRNPSDSGKLVLVMTVNGFSDPNAAPSYRFSPDALYRFDIDNTGDAVADEVIDVTFSPLVPGPQTVTAKFPDGTMVTGNTTAPTVTSLDPNDPVIIDGPAGIKVFAGPRDDPFFFDVVGFNRFLAGTGGFSGTDSFADANVSAIVVEFPVELVDGGGDTLQIWGETQRPFPGFSGKKGKNAPKQIERMANPGVNTVFIPLALKDQFNRTAPADDADEFADVILARLAALGTNATFQGILASVAVPDTLKYDLTQGDGFPNGRALDDDVIATVLTLVFNGAPTDDGVLNNDKSFLAGFPYLAAPHQAP